MLIETQTKTIDFLQLKMSHLAPPSTIRQPFSAHKKEDVVSSGQASDNVVSKLNIVSPSDKITFQVHPFKRSPTIQDLSGLSQKSSDNTNVNTSNESKTNINSKIDEVANNNSANNTTNMINASIQNTPKLKSSLSKRSNPEKYKSR